MRMAGHARAGCRPAGLFCLGALVTLLSARASAATQQDPGLVTAAIRQAAAAMAPANATIDLGPVMGARYMRAHHRPEVDGGVGGRHGGGALPRSVLDAV
jgi:hypothetical protein